jgi:hypothetical protein
MTKELAAKLNGSTSFPPSATAVDAGQLTDECVNAAPGAIPVASSGIVVAPDPGAVAPVPLDAAGLPVDGSIPPKLDRLAGKSKEQIDAEIAKARKNAGKPPSKADQIRALRSQRSTDRAAKDTRLTEADKAAIADLKKVGHAPGALGTSVTEIRNKPGAKLAGENQESDVTKKTKKTKAKSAPKTKAAVANGAPRTGSKTELIAGLLTRAKGCTGAEILEATGWPTVSVPAQAKAAGLKLRKEKAKGEPTRYYGTAA